MKAPYERGIRFRWRRFVLRALSLTPILLFAVEAGAAPPNQSAPTGWTYEWPDTDFSRAAIDFSEILSGGPPKDGIPAIDAPEFLPLADVTNLADTEPVVGLLLNGEARAYPLRVLIWHEIVNDKVGGVPVTVTYCPLCNSSIVFDRRLDGRVLDFGTTGKLRNSDLVMYDRQTESWWQQFTGTGIVGEMTGRELEMIPSRLESFANFAARAPNGRVLVPNQAGMRNYGGNPYRGYDSRNVPYGFFSGEMPPDVNPMVRVVAVDGEAWTLPLLRQNGEIRKGDLTIRWSKGQNSALDSGVIAAGRDVGNVVVMRGEGADVVDVVHDVTFAFVFHAFHPEGQIHSN